MVKREHEDDGLPDVSRRRRANVVAPSASPSPAPNFQQQRSKDPSSSQQSTKPAPPKPASSSYTAAKVRSFASSSSSSAPAAAPMASSSRNGRHESHIKSAEAKFWRNDELLRALARVAMPDVSMVLTMSRLSSTTYKAAMAIFLERIEVSRGSILGIHKLLKKKMYLAPFVKELCLSDNWPFNEVWLQPTTSVASSFSQFWPSLTPFMQLADIFSWVCPKNDQNPELRIDVALDFWCLKALYEVCRAQRPAAARIRAIRVTGTAPHYIPPSTVKQEERAAFLRHFEGVMWASLESIMRMSDKLELFQVLPRGDTSEVVTLPATIPMSLADCQRDVNTIKLTIFPEHRYALLAFAKHYWNSLTSLSLSFVNAEQYPYEMKELDIMLGRKWLDLVELRISFVGQVSDALRWSWSHPRLKILDVDMCKASEERIIKFVHDHPSIEHLSMHSDQKCKRPSRYPPQLRSCVLWLPGSKKDPFAAATESGAPYVTAFVKGRSWEMHLTPSVPWTEPLANLTALDIVLDPNQFTTVCDFFGPVNSTYFPNLLEICLVCHDKFASATTFTKRLQSGLGFFVYALEHLRYLPRVQVVALNSTHDDALDQEEVRGKLLQVAPSLRAAAWLTSSEEAQIFSVQHIPILNVRKAALLPVSPYLAGFSRLDCGQEERGWPFDYGFFLHSPDGRAVPRSSMVSFPG
ncbi:hypothetical protein A4X13_0g1925 [Tilletia indica]|uniref:Uncharacterized protein n=1 Tax=Tilletia indica TaxID=43049 RepID=A0A177TSR9_9BASI|nr:hypothetical protein A4X13_0g1925 [Tilletia indica]